MEEPLEQFGRYLGNRDIEDSQLGQDVALASEVTMRLMADESRVCAHCSWCGSTSEIFSASIFTG